MPTMYCALCQRPVEAKRQIGIGTVILAVVSGGLWLAAVPFYSKRCSICKSAAVSTGVPAASGPQSDRLAELEQRLLLTEGELEVATTELDRVRTERDFYRQLLDDPAKRERDRPRSE